MLENKIIICGAGQRGKYLINKFPEGVIKYFVDSDVNKINTYINSIKIISYEALKNMNLDNYDIIISLESSTDGYKEISEKLIKYNISFYSSSINEKNCFFNTPEYIDYLDKGLLYKNAYDKYELNSVFETSFENWFRKDFFSELNQKVVECMKADNKEYEDILNDYYSSNDKGFDEYYIRRPGMRLVKNILQQKGNKFKICDVACGNAELLEELFKDGHKCFGTELYRGGGERTPY